MKNEGVEQTRGSGVFVNLADIEFHIYPPSPTGGQHVRRASGVLVVHKPSGLAVVWMEERSQHANRQKALARLELLLRVTEHSRASEKWNEL